MYIPPRFIIEDDDTDLLRRFTAYIKGTIRYSKLEYYRKFETSTKESPLDDFPPELLSYEDTLMSDPDELSFEDAQVSAAFSNLNTIRQQILTLVFVEGLSALETAERLGCSVDYVYLHKHRALKKLRDQLMEGGDGHGE